MSSLLHPFHTVRKGVTFSGACRTAGRQRRCRRALSWLLTSSQGSCILWEPYDDCAVILSVGPFWGTCLWGFAVPACLQFGNRQCFSWEGLPLLMRSPCRACTQAFTFKIPLWKSLTFHFTCLLYLMKSSRAKASPVLSKPP